VPTNVIRLVSVERGAIGVRDCSDPVPTKRTSAVVMGAAGPALAGGRGVPGAVGVPGAGGLLSGADGLALSMVTVAGAALAPEAGVTMTTSGLVV
jgi:hypothetical protein